MNHIIKSAAVALTVALSMNATNAMAKSQVKTFAVTHTTEHKVHEFYGFGGEKFCVWGKNADGETVPIKVRRTLNGGKKGLGSPTGGKCYFTKPGAYIVYVTAIRGDTKVYVEVWGNAFDKPVSPDDPWAMSNKVLKMLSGKGGGIKIQDLIVPRIRLPKIKF